MEVYVNMNTFENCVVRFLSDSPENQPIELWKELLAVYTPEQCTRRVFELLTPDVKKLLNRKEPPSLEDLLALAWTDTEAPGA